MVHGVGRHDRLSSLLEVYHPLILFVIYVMACAAFELVSAWRSVLADLDLVADPPPPAQN